jgi:hypothetical protein
METRIYHVDFSDVLGIINNEAKHNTNLKPPCNNEVSLQLADGYCTERRDSIVGTPSSYP